MLSDEEDNLIDFLEAQYGCHTVILYGSRARGTARLDSDWDILALNHASAPDWCHQQVPGVGEVNAYIHPTAHVEYHPANPSSIYRPPEYFIRLRHGRVLVEENGLGTTLITRARQMFERGPGRKPPHFEQNQRHQFYGTWLAAIEDPRRSAMERQYYRARMLHHCLDSYFRNREMWWGMSANDGFDWLQTHDRAAYDAFEQALRPDADEGALRRLVDHVFVVEGL